MFSKKARAEISYNLVRFSRRDLPYETDLGPKTKTDKMIFPVDFRTRRLNFGFTNFKTQFIEYVRMDCRNHFGFQDFFDFDLIFIIEITLFWKKILFEISVKTSKFSGDVFSKAPLC